MFSIIVDSREKRGYDFRSYPVKVIKGKLDTGDYAIQSLASKCAIERKSSVDWVGSITSGRERFEREMVRGSKLDFFAVIIEGKRSNIKTKCKYSLVGKKTILNSAYHWEAKYGFGFHFAENRRESENMVYEMFRAYVKYKVTK